MCNPGYGTSEGATAAAAGGYREIQVVERGLLQGEILQHDVAAPYRQLCADPGRVKTGRVVVGTNQTKGGEESGDGVGLPAAFLSIPSTYLPARRSITPASTPSSIVDVPPPASPSPGRDEIFGVYRERGEGHIGITSGRPPRQGTAEHRERKRTDAWQ